MKNVDWGQFVALVEAGAVRDVRLIGTDAGFLVEINGDTMLYTARKAPRSWARIENLMKALHGIGINRFTVDDLQSWKP